MADHCYVICAECHLCFEPQNRPLCWMLLSWVSLWWMSRRQLKRWISIAHFESRKTHFNDCTIFSIFESQRLKSWEFEEECSLTIFFSLWKNKCHFNKCESASCHHSLIKGPTNIKNLFFSNFDCILCLINILSLLVDVITILIVFVVRCIV